MTRLITEPDALPLLYPKACEEDPVKIRLVAQVHHYDADSASLWVSRLPNLPELVVRIDLEEETQCNPSPSLMQVNVSHVLEQLLSESSASGLAVSIIGVFDGRTVTAFECMVIDGQLLIDGRIELLAQMATIKPL